MKGKKKIDDIMEIESIHTKNFFSSTSSFPSVIYIFMCIYITILNIQRKLGLICGGNPDDAAAVASSGRE